MRTLLTIHESDINPQAIDQDPTDFKERLAARAVVLNGQGQVALLKASERNYHKLPGGGIESEEEVIQALRRELLEEIGCDGDVYAEIGKVIEYRDQWKMKQVSECYLVMKKGQQQPTAFTEEEIQDGFEVIWVTSIEAAIALLEHDDPSNYDGRFIQQRDGAILKVARELYDTAVSN